MNFKRRDLFDTFLLFAIIGLCSCNSNSTTVISTEEVGTTQPKINTSTQNDSLTFIAYKGYTGVYPGFRLKIDDRFNFFNEEIWQKGDCGFMEPASRFTPNNVKVIDGIMKLIIDKEELPGSVCSDGREIGPKQYSAAEVRSKERFLYGRFEARIKTPHTDVASGYIASLFTYVNDVPDPFSWREIDIEMEGIRPNKFQSNLIFGEGTWEWWRTREWGAYEEKHVIGPTSEWKVYAFEWVPDAIRWYVDGKMVRKLTQKNLDDKATWTERQKFAAKIPELAQQIMMNFWIPNKDVADTFGGSWERNVYPMVTEYDWFRYYEYIAE